MLGRTGTVILSIILVIVFVSVASATILTSDSSVTTKASGYANITSPSTNYVLIDRPGVIDFNFTLYSNNSKIYIFDYNNFTYQNQSVNLTCFNTTQYPGNYVLLNNFKNGTEVHLKLYVNKTVFNYIPESMPGPKAEPSSIVKILVMSPSGAFAATGFAIFKV